MTTDSTDWVGRGQGLLPLVGWSFTTDGPLVDLQLAKETGQILAADQTGGFYLLNPLGQVKTLNRLATTARRLAFSDTGNAAAVLVDDSSVGWMDQKLRFVWSRELPDDVLGLGISPFGTHVAIAMADANNAIFDASNSRYSLFESIRPLRHIQFLTQHSSLIVAAEHGLVARYKLDGQPEWTEKVWSTVGELSASGDGKSVWLAGFMHGLQLFSGEDGATRGSFVLDGTVSHVSISYDGSRIFAATLEGHVMCFSERGGLTWAVQAPDKIVRLAASPVGQFVICGLETGQILRLDCTS
jgi:hypothetical protein